MSDEELENDPQWVDYWGYIRKALKEIDGMMEGKNERNALLEVQRVRVYKAYHRNEAHRGFFPVPAV